MLAVASRVTRALELTLSQPSFLETLVKEYGLCVEEVCMRLQCQYMLAQAVSSITAVHLAGADVS